MSIRGKKGLRVAVEESVAVHASAVYDRYLLALWRTGPRRDESSTWKREGPIVREFCVGFGQHDACKINYVFQEVFIVVDERLCLCCVLSSTAGILRYRTCIAYKFIAPTQQRANKQFIVLSTLGITEEVVQ